MRCAALVSLNRPYPSRYGVPVVERLDPRIFTHTYFTHCMRCQFCHDACCAYGVEVDVAHTQRLALYADALEPYLGLPRSQWLQGDFIADASAPGGRYTRTHVVDGACVFLNRQGRGCRLHAFGVETGVDYHLLKPMYCALFPMTIDAGVLRPAYEVLEQSLVCLNTGPTLYQGGRDELRYYFGADLVDTLDAVAT